jgi:hypothetical protein
VTASPQGEALLGKPYSEFVIVLFIKPANAGIINKNAKEKKNEHHQSGLLEALRQGKDL